MDPNTHSTQQPGGLDRLATVVEELAAEDPDALPDAEAARRVLVLRRLLERLEGHWLRELAGVDGRGAAGAEDGVPAASTAGWLRHRTRMGHPHAHHRVRVASALHHGPLAGTAQALADGELSYPHAAALTRSTQDLPAATVAAAEPMLLDAARHLDPPGLRKVVDHLCEVADPDAADQQTQRRHDRRGLWLSPTLEGMVAIDGLLDPEAGETLLTALEPLTRPSTADNDRSAAQRRADALTELARRQLAGGRLPKTGGVRPQLAVTIELASLLGQPGLPGGEGGWVGHYRPRPPGGGPATPPSPGCWSPATPTTRPATATTTKPGSPATATRPATWPPGSVPPWTCSHPPLVALPPSRWRWAAPPG